MYIPSDLKISCIHVYMYSVYMYIVHPNTSRLEVVYGHSLITEQFAGCVQEVFGWVSYLKLFNTISPAQCTGLCQSSRWADTWIMSENTSVQIARSKLSGDVTPKMVGEVFLLITQTFFVILFEPEFELSANDQSR